MWSGIFCSTYAGVIQLIPRYFANAAQLILRCSPYWSPACPGIWGFATPFYLGYFALYPRIVCLSYVHHGIACLASQASDWASALWDSLSSLWLATLC